MKTLKQALIALALVMTALAIIGCPSPTNGPPNKGGGGEEPTNGFKINGGAVTNGRFDTDLLTAKKGVTVTITVRPESGYELDGEPHVEHRDQGVKFNDIVSSTQDRNKWTFEMPEADVTITGSFITYSSAIDAASRAIKQTSDWEEITRLTAMINDAFDKYARAAVLNPNNAQEKLVIDAIEKLAGKGIEKKEGEAPYGDLFYWTSTASSFGLIRDKIRQEKVKDWTTDPLASYPQDIYTKEGDDNPTNVAGQGYDRSKLYYVKSEIGSKQHPAITLPAGWKDQEGQSAINFFGKEGIIIDHLSYRVGGETITYDLWYWPVAQYKVIYESGASGKVTIVDYFNGNTGGEESDKNELTESKDCTGNVGKGYAQAPNFYTLFTPPADHKITVTELDGDGKPKFVTSYGNTTETTTTAAPYNGLETARRFYAESKVYTVTVSRKN